ncbi:Hemoglobin subunit zeta [Pteropus alecto]|uniref:Hemoglobin subunit zeta n=1 Tax=Pteropus alecto TaxID=9402 RepID=L5KGV2_PTEAL|nr:Hemoglobin subunit zeta [Pteropus alecto]
MSLIKSERTVIMSMWGKISTQADAIGTEALERLFTSYPQTKTYFPHFDLHPGSAQLRLHGSKVVAAVGDAVKSIDNIAGALFKLSELHAYVVRVDPVNFKVGAGAGPLPGQDRGGAGCKRGRVFTPTQGAPSPALSRPPTPQLLSYCLLVTVALHFPADFKADAHAAWDKFLSIISNVLTEKYRRGQSPDPGGQAATSLLLPNSPTVHPGTPQ